VLNPIHEWEVGRGKARSSVILIRPNQDVLASVGRRGVGLLFLTDLWVPTHARRRGHAHALLEAVTSWADSADTDLWLYCSPHGPGAPHHRLDIAGLAKLYEDHGFAQVNPESPDYEMVRRCSHAWAA
jgi:GNAT superfamily N-acetyltransferase